MKVWDNADPSAPVLRDVPDFIAQSWLVNPGRFTAYVEPTPEAPKDITVDGVEYEPVPTPTTEEPEPVKPPELTPEEKVLQT